MTYQTNQGNFTNMTTTQETKRKKTFPLEIEEDRVYKNVSEALKRWKPIDVEIAEKVVPQGTKEQHTVAASKPIAYNVPDGYDNRVDHFANFFEAIRSKKPD